MITTIVRLEWHAETKALHWLRFHPEHTENAWESAVNDILAQVTASAEIVPNLREFLADLRATWQAWQGENDREV